MIENSNLKKQIKAIENSQKLHQTSCNTFFAKFCDNYLLSPGAFLRAITKMDMGTFYYYRNANNKNSKFTKRMLREIIELYTCYLEQYVVPKMKEILLPTLDEQIDEETRLAREAKLRDLENYINESQNKKQTIKTNNNK